jgi:hypothetical protein
MKASEGQELLFDKRDIPIAVGDLIRTPHYIGARRKQHYLYHTIVMEDGNLFMVPTSHLEPTLRDDGGKCPAKYGMDKNSEIISGHGPGDCITFEDRKRGSGTGASLQGAKETER